MTNKTNDLVTITDVAREAGVSIATVSRAVNQPNVVTKKTLTRVNNAMRRLNYNPNKLANSLRSGRSKSVALLVGDITGPFFGALAKSLSNQGTKRGHNIVLHDLENSSEALVSILSGLHPTEAANVVIALSSNLRSPEVKDAISQAQRRGIRVVTNSQIVDATVPAVLPQFDIITGDATRYLHGLNARSFVFVGGSSDAPMARQGAEGFEDACTSLGMQSGTTHCVTGDFRTQLSRDRVTKILKDILGKRASDPSGLPVGIICQTTRMTVGAMLAAFDLGLSVPEDVKIVCCEELRQATAWRPEFTTISVPMDDIGSALFDQLLAKPGSVQHTYLSHRLIERGSTSLR